MPLLELLEAADENERLRKALKPLLKLKGIAEETHKFIGKNYSFCSDASFGAWARNHMEDMSDAILAACAALEGKLEGKSDETPAKEGENSTSLTKPTIAMIQDELERAMTLHAPMRGPHEGYAVILEELDELWQEIKQKSPDIGKLRTEAIHVAAMAARFVADLTMKAKGEHPFPTREAQLMALEKWWLKRAHTL